MISTILYSLTLLGITVWIAPDFLPFESPSSLIPIRDLRGDRMYLPATDTKRGMKYTLVNKGGRSYRYYEDGSVVLVGVFHNYAN